MPIRQFVHVRNVDSVEHTIFDKRFSGGKLTLQPGEEYDLANDVWMDHRRRHQAWLKDTYVLEQQAAAAELAAQEVGGEQAPVESDPEETAAEEESTTEAEATEEVAEQESEPVTEKATAETVQEQAPATELKMPEIRARAKELGVKIPVGISKVEAAKLVAEAEAVAGEQPEEGKTDEN